MACSSIASDELNEINHNETICVASYLAKLKAEGYNCRILPWVVVKKFENEVDVETWQKFGTPYLLRGTHGGESTLSKCKIICKDDDLCEKHFAEQKKGVVIEKKAWSWSA